MGNSYFFVCTPDETSEVQVLASSEPDMFQRPLTLEVITEEGTGKVCLSDAHAYAIGEVLTRLARENGYHPK